MRISLVLLVSSLACASSPEPGPPPGPPPAPEPAPCPTEGVLEASARTCPAGRTWTRHECSEAEPCIDGWMYPHQGAEEGCALPDGTFDGPYVRFSKMGAVVARGLLEGGEMVASRSCAIPRPPRSVMERPWPDPKTH